MSRVITFSRVFPPYHPRAGEPTYFVEKMIQWYWDNISDVMRGYHNVPTMLCALNHNKFPRKFYEEFSDNLNTEVNDWKSHTVRGGQRFKAGEYFKPCVWTGKPYRSLQLQFLPALQIPKIQHFDIIGTDWSIDGRLEYALVGEGFNGAELAHNDGLSYAEFDDWFTASPDFKKSKEFHGQIICWNKNINY